MAAASGGEWILDIGGWRLEIGDWILEVWGLDFELWILDFFRYTCMTSCCTSRKRSIVCR